MRKLFLLFLLAACLAPTAAKALNAQAQEYDELGMALYRQGLYSKSIPYFQNAVQADPTDWEGYENLGNAYFKTNDNANALSAYQKSLQINPDNSTLDNIVQSLQNNTSTAGNDSENTGANAPPSVSNPPPAGAVPPNSSQSSVDSEQPIENNPPTTGAPQPNETIVVHHRRHWNAYQPAPEPNYADGLAPINHSKFWVDADLAYNWSNQADFFYDAGSENSYIQQNGFSGIAAADNGGIEGGGEFGFMLNPYNGIAIGIRGIASNPYNSSINYQNGGDFETINIQPYVIPLTLDYYLFLPDHDGRFFLTAGVGYYFADVSVNDNYSYYNSGGPTDQLVGDMYGGNIGFQFGVGREFEISQHLGLRLFARGRYCKITNINGYFTSAAGAYDDYGLVAAPSYLGGGMYVDSTSNIGSGGEHYATLDYTGFDIGVGLTFF